MDDPTPETERLTGRCTAMTLSGARLNGDFFLLCQLPIWTWSAPTPPGKHDDIKLLKLSSLGGRMDRVAKRMRADRMATGSRKKGMEKLYVVCAVGKPDNEEP
jgi:hypothetical protein